MNADNISKMEKNADHTEIAADMPAVTGAAGWAPEHRARVEKSMKRKLDARCSLFVLIYIMNYLDRNNIAAARLRGLEEDLNLKDALAVGGAQALALIPGASRSGTKSCRWFSTCNAVQSPSAADRAAAFPPSPCSRSSIRPTGSAERRQ